MGYSHKNLSLENSQFVWSQLYAEVLLRMGPSELATSRREAIKLYRQRSRNNLKQLKIIDEFESDYKHKNALKWYTRALFLYEPLNKALRQNDLESLFIYRFFLYDINRHLAKLQEEFLEPTVCVYRFQGQVISMNSLFSTSRRQDVAQLFMESSITSNTTDSQYSGVLFEIQANTRYDPDESRTFADISKLSQHPDEQEVLFMAGCVFRLLSVTHREEEKFWLIKLELCSQNEHELQEFYRWLRASIAGQTDIDSLCYVLRDMGRLDQAEQLYYGQLADSKEMNKFYILIRLGQIAHAKHENDRALKLYEDALKRVDDNVDMTMLGAFYNCIGDAHRGKKDFESALNFYQLALDYLLRSVGENHLDTARVHENLGRVCHIQGKFDLASDHLKKCLETRQRYLPEHHLDTAQAHILLGDTYQAQNQLSNSWHHYSKGLMIRKKFFVPTDSCILETEQAIKDVMKRINT